MSAAAPRAVIVSIGDELLRGDTVDGNAAFLAKELTARGVAVKFGLTLPDEIDVIVREVRALLPQYDLIFVGGGIGPTTDDVTRQALAAAFGRELELYPAAVEHYTRFIGQPLNAGQRAMCTLPAGSELWWSPRAAAPAFRIDNVYVMPGVPQIMRWMWAEIAERFSGVPQHVARFRASCGESRFMHVMEQFVAAHPGLTFGSYPKMDDSGWWAEVMVRGADAAEVERVAAAFEAGIEAVGG